MLGSLPKLYDVPSPSGNHSGSPNRPEQGTPDAPPTKRDTHFRGSDLLRLVLPDPKWAIEGILPEGLSILGGKPKMGKSWMGLGIAVAIATGGVALGNKHVEKGEVLYMGLEDNPRRLQSRLKKMQEIDESSPLVLDGLYLATEWPRLDMGGLTQLAAWLSEHLTARLVVIDTLARIKPRRRTNGSSYEDDYASLEGLQTLANQHNVAVVVITHLRKMDADDPMDTLNATLGLSGAADAILILKRERGRHDATLFVSGRDVEEQELALKFDTDIASWSVIGDASEYRQSEARREIIDVLRKSEGPQTPKDVADILGKNHNAVKKLMWQMGGDGTLRSQDGKYGVVDKVTTVTG